MASPGSSPKPTPDSPGENDGSAGEAAHQPKHGATPDGPASSAKEAVDAAKETASNAVASAREKAAEAKARASEAAAEAKQRAAEAVDAARARAAEAREAAKAKLDKSDPEPAPPDLTKQTTEDVRKEATQAPPAATPTATRSTAADRAEPAVTTPPAQTPTTPPAKTPAKTPAGKTPATTTPAATTPAAKTPATTPAAPAEPSIGDLVSTATNAMSTLVRSEIELAKLELRSTVKNAGTGLGLFLGAVVVLVFSLTFGFIALAEGINALGLARWLSFLIVFGFQLLVVGLFVFIGMKKVKAVRAPEKTIRTTKETVDYLKTKRG